MFVENLAPFFDVTGFGKSATITIGTGAPAAATVIFNRAYLDPLGAFEGTAPVAWIQRSEAVSVAQGDTLLVDATTYSVVEVMPDESGDVLMLRLRN